MLTREVFVRGRNVYANGDTSLIRTSQGVYDMHVLFDASEWLDFPVVVVFGYGESQVSQTLILSALASAEWAAEATIEIPWEVMQALGKVSVTFVGETGGDRIITAEAGYELWTVVEEGEVSDGTVPTPAPTIDEWNQAYADAVAAANGAESAAANANGAAVLATSAAQEAVDAVQAGVPLMAADTRGGAKLGAGLAVGQDEALGLTPATASAIGGVIVDGTTITVDANGVISVAIASGDEVSY